MKSSSWRFRRRSTGHLPQLDQFQQQFLHGERGKSFDAGPMQPIDEHPCISSPPNIRKNRSFTDNSDNTDSLINSKGMANNVGSSFKPRKKASFTSYMQIPVIGGSRSNSPNPQQGGAVTTNGNDSDSISSRSSVSTSATVSLPRTPLLQQSTSFTGSADWTLQREMTLEEELEIQLHKITGAAQEWKNRYLSEHAQCAQINKLMLDREREYKSILGTLTQQYDSQIIDVRNKLFIALDTADALAEENKRMDADLKDLQQKSTMRTNALEKKVSDALEEMQKLRDKTCAMQERIEELQVDKERLLTENDSLKRQADEWKEKERKAREMLQKDRWSEYYRIVLDLALDKLRGVDHGVKKTKLQATKSASGQVQAKANIETKQEVQTQGHESHAQGHLSPPMDTRSMDSMTSQESLLSDMTDSLSSSARTQNLMDVDYNDNVMRKAMREIHGSPQIPPRHRHGHRHSHASIDHQRQASEPLTCTDITRSLSALDDPTRNPMQISFSDTNLYSLFAYGRPEDRYFDEGKVSGMSTPMPTLVEAPIERSSLERKRANFIKSYSDDVPFVQDSQNTSVSESSGHDLPLIRVLSDGAAEPAKRKSPAQSPQVKVKANAKKAARQIKFIKRWQAGEIDFPWKRRNTRDVPSKTTRDDTTLSLPRRHEIGESLKDKLEQVAKTRSQEDLLSFHYDDMPPIIITRSGSITSASSAGSVDYDLEGQDSKVTISTSTQSGFEQLRSKKNGVLDGGDIRKSPTKSEAKGQGRPKSMETDLDGQPVTIDTTSSKPKFFKKKYWSVKK